MYLGCGNRNSLGQWEGIVGGIVSTFKNIFGNGGGCDPASDDKCTAPTLIGQAQVIFSNLNTPNKILNFMRYYVAKVGVGVVCDLSPNGRICAVVGCFLAKSLGMPITFACDPYNGAFTNARENQIKNFFLTKIPELEALPPRSVEVAVTAPGLPGQPPITPPSPPYIPLPPYIPPVMQPPVGTVPPVVGPTPPYSPYPPQPPWWTPSPPTTSPTPPVTTASMFKGTFLEGIETNTLLIGGLAIGAVLLLGGGGGRQRGKY